MTIGQCDGGKIPQLRFPLPRCVKVEDQDWLSQHLSTDSLYWLLAVHGFTSAFFILNKFAH